MKKIAAITILICALFVACTSRFDDKDFIRNMYEKCLYENYAFLEKHCSKDLLTKLAKEYDYEGEGYAVWRFRSAAQDGPSNEHAMKNIEDEGNGWYRYTAIDMGITFTKRIKLSHKGNKIIIEDLADTYRHIAPLASNLDLNKLQDCTIPAAFTPSDFDWTNGKLTVTVYTMDLYDAVEISQMKVGDTLIYEGKPMVVNTILENHGGLAINGDLDEGGCCLVGYEGGTYIARNWDDHATYTKLGKTNVALAEDFAIIDCGDFPNDPYVTIRKGQQSYIEKLKDGKKDFFQLNTRVTIEHGKVTEINRKWIP